MSQKYSRRDLFRMFGSRGRRVTDAAAGKEHVRPPMPRSPGAFRLRPPGWHGEQAEACKACVKCMLACPQDALLKDLDGTPYILPEQSPCVLCEDLPCVEACPSEVLVLEDRRQARMGTARIVEGLCAHARDEPCSACYTACPLPGEAVVLVTGGPAGPRPVIRDDVCTGCGACLNACPERPRAIRIDPPGGVASILPKPTPKAEAKAGQGE